MAARDVVVIGRAGDAYELREFLSRAEQPYRLLDPDMLEAHGISAAQLPVVIIDGETVLVSPKLEELGDALGVRRPPSKTEYDVIVVGAGPAGLAAACYAASDGLSVVVVERSTVGGQAGFTSRIENYFGIDPLGPPMTGAHLAQIGSRQAEAFGAELLLLRSVVGATNLDDGRREVELSTGEKLRGRAGIIASGVDWRRLDVDGIDEFLGRGVYYGAGRSEAPLLSGRRVVVVGAGNSAGQATLNFAEHDAKVTMLARGDHLSRSLSAYLVRRIEADSRVEVRLESEVTAVAGDGHLQAITINDAEVLPTDALVVAIGGTPRTQWAPEIGLTTDPGGYLLTGHDLFAHGHPPASWPLERPPLALEASVPGIFIAGDVRHGSIKRVAGAVGEGATAVALIHQYFSTAESPR
jgi:thioredoxin reductase (NADPH)